MSDLPPPPATTPVSPPWVPSMPSMRRRQWPMFTLLAVGLVVTFGVAIAGWFRPAPAYTAPEAPRHTDQQVADAKAKVCSTYEQVRKAVVANTSRNGGNDPTTTLAVAANARTALYDGGDYLSKTLAQQPATPLELAKAVQTLINSYQQLAIDYMAEAPDSEQQSARDAVNNAGTTVYGLCK